MNDSTITLPWLVVRQDDNGNRYRVGRYATRAEAQKIADSLGERGHKQLYWVECVGQPGGPAGSGGPDGAAG
ncbi:SPOR domain-containing protein [Streptomyces sp. NPDC056160]|uniref:SPOR domain-containing protein n=1 Tax=Streptomyces sp. NPDC056160 TaxID=3345731 RepID=UPI0035E2EEC4